jgi:hypothetical protein
MNKQYTLSPDGSFTINNYGKAYPFSNFLPGVAGEWGIPLWVFYVNRGQGVVSFGIQDKDHAITEFYPANKAYSVVPYIGFRTFIKAGQEFYEPFAVNSPFEPSMNIKSASLALCERNTSLGLEVHVRYGALPNSSVGALTRAVTIKNISSKPLNIEALDGLSRIIPFGSIHPFLKDISRTLEAWMQVSVEKNLAMFNLVVDPKDVSLTRHIEGANFHYSFYEEKGKKQQPFMVVDPNVVFSQDTSYTSPCGFIDKKFKVPHAQIKVGKTPCSFSHVKWSIAPGSEKTLYSVFGASFKQALIKKNVKKFSAGYFNDKEKENDVVIEGIKKHALCVSGNDAFNHYVQGTYLDNVLRGGLPYCVDGQTCNGSGRNKNKNAYYIFSRKHGDLERDYNYFNLLPSYFSEGQSNYRDVNQNRRMDLFFNPSLGFQSLVYFMNFLKIDGYNPLVIKGEKLFFEKQRAKTLLDEFSIKDRRLQNCMVKGFYLGDFFKLLEEEEIRVKPKMKEELVKALLIRAKREPQAHHGEGYWIDHWRYNLDLIESYLYFYPDKEKELFLTNSFVFWDDEHKVRPRAARYVIRSGKVYQGDSIEVVREKNSILKERAIFKNFLRTKKGDIYKTNLVVKLLALVVTKLSTLDPDGIGIEMEADKPGWCDSLNGLPALFGSSVCETFELKRTVQILLGTIKKLSEDITDVSIPRELAAFASSLQKLLRSNLQAKSKTKDFIFWDKANSLKEEFREKTFFAFSGREAKVSLKKLERLLQDALTKLNTGINKAKDKKSGLYTTYFIYELKKYAKKNNHIVPISFSRKPVALSLEAVMHALRVEGKHSLVSNVKASVLFDKKLKMYRLNASFKNEPLEIGRSRVFVPGWLENESIWLHMEYKYILELLKQGFYKEFYNDLHNCCACFFDPKIYGRNILENSSFIVSSAYPDKSLWGKGFVARLSGATAEFMNIWIVMCLGHNPFSVGKKGLSLKFAPILEKELFTKEPKTIDYKGKNIILPKNSFSFNLFSNTLVCYHNPKRKDTFSKEASIEKIIITLNGKKIIYYNDTIKAPHSLSVRRAEAERIDVYFK